MSNIHEHYDKLDLYEKMFVDEQFENIFKAAREKKIRLFGNDHAEIAVDALARLIVVSRKAS